MVYMSIAFKQAHNLEWGAARPISANLAFVVVVENMCHDFEEV